MRQTGSLLLMVGLCFFAIGCDSDDALELILPDVEGTWTYQMTTVGETTLSNCTGDLASYEDVGLEAAMVNLPICLAGGSFPVVQNGAAFQLDTFTASCSNGASGTVTGVGTLVGNIATGEWDSQSDDGVDVIRDFNGAVTGPTLLLVETDITFGGTLQGSCDFSPPLAATVTIQ